MTLLVVLLCAALAAPLYWLAAPARWRRECVALASLVALGLFDAGLLAALTAFCLVLFALLRAIAASSTRGARSLAGVGLVALVGLFLWNKGAADVGGALPSQSGLLFVGFSYLALKAAAALLDAVRTAAAPPSLRDLVSWLVFLPTYLAGPIETLPHFRDQVPSLDAARISRGLERILFGLAKAVIASHYLGLWAGPILAEPEAHGALTLLAGAYAFVLRFYFDFAGYSDIAIGVAALFGFEISENFDRPLVRRNLAQLWQGWHMTLTAWLRRYLFIPLSRGLMRRGGAGWDVPAVVVAQLVTMLFCGLWHGVGWEFVLWGLLQGMGLVWVGVVARPVGDRLPALWIGWWRRSPLAHGLSVALTFNFFALSSVCLFSDLTATGRYFGALASALSSTLPPM